MNQTMTYLMLPPSIIVEHVIPFLDRDTYNNCVIANKEILNASKRVTTPPWPQKCIRVGPGVSSTKFSPNGGFLACGCHDGTARIWRRNNGQRTVLHGHESEVISLAFSPNEKLLATGSNDCTVCLWHLDCSTCVAVLKGHNSPVLSLSFSPDGKILASNGREKMVRLWSIPSGHCTELIEHSENLESVAYSPDGQTLASVTWNGVVHLWKDGNVKLLGKGLPSTTISFSEDGLFLFGFRGFRIRQWNMVDGSCSILTGRRVDIKVNSVALSPDRQIIAYGESDGTVYLSTVADSICKATIKSKMKGQNSICVFAFSPEGRTLASGSSDGTVRLCDI
jgi:WD40 repeat protein